MPNDIIPYIFGQLSQAYQYINRGSALCVKRQLAPKRPVPMTAPIRIIYSLKFRPTLCHTATAPTPRHHFCIPLSELAWRSKHSACHPLYLLKIKKAGPKRSYTPYSQNLLLREFGFCKISSSCPRLESTAH